MNLHIAGPTKIGHNLVPSQYLKKIQTIIHFFFTLALKGDDPLGNRQCTALNSINCTYSWKWTVYSPIVSPNFLCSCIFATKV